MLPLLILFADVDAVLAHAREVTRPEPRCARSHEADITVCGRRAADRYRVPFVVYEAGDPRRRTVSAERNGLLRVPDACQAMRAIQVGCGFAGLAVTTNRSGTRLSGREMAP